MPLKRSKKTSKKTEQEGSFAKTRRLRREKETKEAKAKIKAEEEAKKEETRKHKIIYKYVKKLSTKLEEDDSTDFWVWADRPGFKKMVLGYKEMKAKLMKAPKKYKNRFMAHVSIMLRHDKHGQERLFGQEDEWLSVGITVYELNDKAEIGAIRPKSCLFVWLTDDFKATKFSFKLVETIMRIVAAREIEYFTISGIPLSTVLNHIKRRRLNIDHVLQPLAGV